MAELPRFDRSFFEGPESFTLIGSGHLGGKASGLLDAHRALADRPDGLRLAELEIEVPTLAVIGTDVFDAFLDQNGLRGRDWLPDSDRRIAQAFQKASLPAAVSGDLWALVRRVHQPLAVRSSSLLEDALEHPLAGVYATKMIPNAAPDAETRFRRLSEAIRFVYASTFFAAARAYRRTIGQGEDGEKMAVIVQEVVGRRHGPRFYPDLSGVARSVNFYAVAPARREDGIASLALGLGKTIVDGGRSWTYCPLRPAAPAPFNSVGERLDLSQRSFWAVNMGSAPYDPVSEDEHLCEGTLDEARLDGTLAHAASTFDGRRERFVPGAGEGPLSLDFAPLLHFGGLHFNESVRGLLRLFEERHGAPVELELALTLPEGGRPARLGFLQVRPMMAAGSGLVVTEDELAGPGVLVASRHALGDGLVEGLSDVIYVKPAAFDVTRTVAIAAEVEQANRALLEAGRGALLVGFGRWGTSDRFLGIPVDWTQVSAARVFVEASLPGFHADMSQGAHFFHNLLGLKIPYLAVPAGVGQVDFAALDALPAEFDGQAVRHVRVPGGFEARVDGRSGRAVVRRFPA